MGVFLTGHWHACCKKRLIAGMKLYVCLSYRNNTLCSLLVSVLSPNCSLVRNGECCRCEDDIRLRDFTTEGQVQEGRLYRLLDCVAWLPRTALQYQGCALEINVS